MKTRLTFLLAFLPASAFKDSVFALVGYRRLRVDYTNGGILVDTIDHGPVIGLSFRF